MSETAAQPPLSETETTEPEATGGEQATEQPSERRVPEYHVFVEVSPDTFKKVATVNAIDPAAAIESQEPDAKARYAVCASRYWQVGRPKVEQITQVSIEFE
jgi:hypothetical protein